MATSQQPVPLKGVKERLIQKVAVLDDPVAQVIETYVDSLSLPYTESIVAGSDIVTDRFAEHFGTRLRFHHAANDDVLNKKAFEFAFKHAAVAAGRRAEITASSVHAGQDITVDGVPISLKTEADKNISTKVLMISKFMEARWIRDCKSPEDFHAHLPKVLDHMGHYRRILVLRIFRMLESATPSVRYDLVEIPLEVLEKIKGLRPDDFKPPGKKSGGSSAPVKEGARKLFHLRLDGSVEKVTISGLDVTLCPSHATWTVSVPKPLVAAKEEGASPE